MVLLDEPGITNISKLTSTLFIFLYCIGVDSLGVSWDWGKWWTYDGISGPQFWGLINPDWSLCTHGRRQSPINIDPSVLLYDPNLRRIHIDKNKVSGILNNTGHSIILTLGSDGAENEGQRGDYLDQVFKINEEYSNLVDEVLIQTKFRETKPQSINLTGGPLSYKYQISHVQFHLGVADHEGSEHTINGSTFPAELQIYAFNSELYNNFTDAVNKAHGVVAIAVLIQVGSEGHQGLLPVVKALQDIRWAESWALVSDISLRALLPNTHYYITYDGSLTQPPCHETVTWILMNRPVYITKQQMHSLRQLRQGSEKLPKARLVNNYRPTQQLLNRPLRTNIDFSNSEQVNCPSIHRNMHYKANKWR
ncbi:UNVERIFIED_CONTAM: hypothetical protein RMT77_008931 [Armadillidium vulgare]